MYSLRCISSLVTALSVLSINCIQSGVMPHPANVSLIIAVIALLELMASLPPLRITALPALKHNPKASSVTLGRDSYIMPITPIGTLF